MAPEADGGGVREGSKLGGQQIGPADPGVECRLGGGPGRECLGRFGEVRVWSWKCWACFKVAKQCKAKSNRGGRHNLGVYEWAWLRPAGSSRSPGRLASVGAQKLAEEP
eukprot:13230009-Alexandrium_andersonii.AAC.1